MEYRKLILKGLHGIELTATQGEMLRFVLGNNIQQAAVANVTLRVEGQADVYYGADTEPGKTLSAGSTSLEGDWGKIAQYDEFRLKVTSPTYRYYCVRDSANRFLNPQAIRGSAGETITVPANKNVFVGIGSVQVGGVEVAAPAQFFTGTEETQVQVGANVLMVAFDRVD